MMYAVTVSGEAGINESDANSQNETNDFQSFEYALRVLFDLDASVYSLTFC